MPEQQQKSPGFRPKTSEYIIGGVALLITLGLCFAVFFYWDYIEELKHYGYLGVFIISIFAGVTIIVPVPSILLVFTLGSVLNPAIIGVVAGLGEAIGAISIYLTGVGGRSVARHLNGNMYDRFSEMIRRRGSWAVFFMSAILNPLYYPFIVVAGMLRFGLIKLFLLAWAGKTVKNTAIALLGYFGLRSVLRLIGVDI